MISQFTNARCQELIDGPSAEASTSGKNVELIARRSAEASTSGKNVELIARRSAEALTSGKKWRPIREGDKQLLRRVIQHDPEATREFVQRFGGLVWSVLKDGALSPDERSDMFQRVFEHLWERDCYRLRRWEGAGSGRFSSYLAVIVSRLLTDYRRNRASAHGRINRGASLDEASITGFDELQEDPLLNLCRAQRAEVVSTVLSRMSEREQNLILRWHIFEQGYAEIAEGLGITVNNARVALMRAERRLKEALLHTHPDIFGAYV